VEEYYKMKNSINKKIVLMGAFVVVIGIVLTPAASAFNAKSVIDNIQIPNENLIEVEISEYKADGSIFTKTISLKSSDVQNLKNQILKANSLEEKCSILRSFNLIDQEDTPEVWYNGMQEKASKLGLSEELIKEKCIRWRLPILLTFFNSIDAVFVMGNAIRIGTSPLVNFVNAMLNINLKGIDAIDAAWGLVGVVNSNGLLFSHAFVAFPGMFTTLGFVGISIKIPFYVHIFTGFSVVTGAIGIGIHTRDCTILPD
jgi:hypothetical protein